METLQAERPAWESFYSCNPAPADYAASCEQLEEFCSGQAAAGRGLVLVTSGGTTVPLELNTVRFVDNFSSGARGSASAEYFLRQGWAVVFLHRAGSLQPFARHLRPDLLLQEMEELGDGQLALARGPEEERLRPVVRAARAARGRLLQVAFSSLSSYLWLLRAASQALDTKPPGPRSLLYLAAAVSDFYIPADSLPRHKMQSSEGPPAIQLQCVPKMLEPLMLHWAGRSAVVTFKLETDPAILLEKARRALDRYGHRLVIGNLLHTRKREVLLVYRDRTEEVVLPEEEGAAGGEIEERIVARLLATLGEL